MLLHVSIDYFQVLVLYEVGSHVKDHRWPSVSACWALSAQVNLWLGARAQLQLSFQTVTLCGVHVMCGRQWQTCGLCVSVWAGLHWAIHHIWTLCAASEPTFPWCDLRFVLRGHEPRGLRDACSRTDYMFCVSSCLSKPAPDVILETQKSRKGRARARFLSLNEKHTENFSKRISLSFVSSLFPFALFSFFLFFFLITEDSSPERLEVSPSCGQCGGFCRITL